MQTDLTQHVLDSWGPWTDDKESYSPTELRLSAGDGVTLGGPLRVRVSVQARNHFQFVGGAATDFEVRDIFCYTLNIPPGRTWTYPAARLVAAAVAVRPTAARTRGAAARTSRPGAARAAAAARDAETAAASLIARYGLQGANAGFAISIRAAGPDACADPCCAPEPCRPVDPCAPKKDCGCGGKCGCGRHCECGCEGHGDDIPCDFATGRGSHLGSFFPAACEPCAPGACIGMPALKGPSLAVAAARGGTVRTRYFNGMFITKEDLWTDQNNNRLKHALMNRAMGQGVVWGLDVHLAGDAVCVLPGYGVDCCGNDIVISSPYRVDAEALVRDPAARAPLAAARVNRMNLLLEYYECPEEPRPVHGDPCAPETMSCEMSRIRETARLRLIPPCDVNDSGPIKDFLDEVRKLRGDPVVGPILHQPTPQPQPTAAIAPDVPFDVFVEGLDAQGIVGSVQLSPRLSTDSPNVVSDDAKGVPQRSLMTRARITLKADSGFTFLAGDVVKESPPATVTATKTSTTIVWEDNLPQPGDTTPQVFSYRGWKLQNPSGTLSSVTGTRIALTVLPSPPNLRMRLHVEVGPTALDAVAQPPAHPCFAEACDPQRRPRFPVPIPWLHADPRRPQQAGDPKVIVLAILYAMSTSAIMQGGGATTPEAAAGQEAVARALNDVAWKVLYDDVPAGTRLELVQALRRLFQAWCKSLLYPGPRCECGCDPHGVVVGCALVEGGRITMVDPWGGRRWVIHYPLLAYWGKQFGIQPFDALASKFFDLICCVAHQYPSRDNVRPLPGTVLGPPLPPSDVLRPATPRAAVVPLGASTLIFEDPARLPERLRELGITPARTEALEALDFAARVVETMGPQAVPIPGAPVTLYTVPGVPELSFVAPARVETLSGGTGAGPAREPGRLGPLVQTMMGARPTRAEIPALLRGRSERLAIELLRGVAPKPATDDGRAARDAMKAAGIESAADVLAADAEDVHARVLKRSHAAGLTELVDASEKYLAAIAQAVTDTVATFATRDRAVSVDDLREGDAFAAELAAALKGVVPARRVTAAVKQVMAAEG
jgi:hypothetical protein